MVSNHFILYVVLVFLPWSLATHDKQGTLNRNNINDAEWKRAQTLINKLVDESIARRVTNAEKGMTSFLQQNIEKHIKRKSQEYVADFKKGCKDKLEHCDTLAAAGVCKTSKKAMQEHCAKTCSLCQRKYIQINPEVEIVMKPKSSKVAHAVKSENVVKPEMKAAALHNLFNGVLTHGSSIEPLLSQQSSVAMKYHDNKDLSTENEKIKDAQKLLEYVKILQSRTGKHAAVKNKKVSHENAAKKHITKRPSKKSKTKKIKGVPMNNLSKTITYKNQKYKITPVVDWPKISKMLKSLGYKAIHIVGMKNKHLAKGLKDHLQMNGVTKITTGSPHKPHAAPESFVSATHRQKSWHNTKYFKSHCHPMCLVACIASCGPGCCREHDKIDVKTGIAKHCHPMCIETCVPSCGSGCCSAEEEQRRGHKFLHYEKIKASQRFNDEPPKIKPTKKVVKEFKISDMIHRIEKPHPAHVNPKLSSADLYKPKPRLCPGLCNPVCAPACSDACCRFGEYAQSNKGIPSTHRHNPGLVSNVPFPHKHGIPGTAYMCDEACKFHCDQSCAAVCCQPEDVAERDARLQQTYPYNAPSPVMAYEPAIQTLDQPGMMTPMPLAVSNPVARSSTRKVFHITHILHPLERKGLVPGSCPTYCGNHCTPVCARSGCCMK